MAANQEAYDAAYQRALQRKPQYGLWGQRARGLWGLLTAAFEDEYTRQSRQQGERDGTTAREAGAARSVPIL